MNLAILDVAIGLVLIYLLLSLVCSALLEAVNHYANRRGAALEAQLKRLMSERTLAEFCRLPGFAALKTRGEVGSASSPGAASKTPRRPWPFRLRALVDGPRRWLRKHLPTRCTFPAYIPKDTFADLALAWHGQRNQSREWCDDHEFGRVLTCLEADFAGDPAALRARVADWFENAMAHMSGRFKAHTHLHLALMAMLVVVLANADSFRLANDIYRNPAIQTLLVEQATQIDQDGRSRLDSPAALRDALKEVPLLGWPEDGPSMEVFLNPWSLTGYLITVLALMMGADFWFNALRRLVNIRTSLKPEQDAAAGGEAGAKAVAPSAVRGATASAAYAAPSEQDERLNMACAHGAACAYLDDDAEIPAALSADGYRKGPSFSDAGTGSQCRFLESDRYRMLAFRGTEPSEIADIRTDLDKALTVFPPSLLNSHDVRVHQGFVAALASIWPGILEYLRVEPRKPLLLTGHSLGGALAVLAAFVLRFREDDEGFTRPALAGVRSYGQPRVGDAAFAETFDRALRPLHWRVINHRDVVPRLPPRAMGYRHTGRVLYFDQSGTATAEPSQWLRLLDRFPVDAGADWGVQIREYASDHAIAGYVRLLANRIPEPEQTGERP